MSDVSKQAFDLMEKQYSTKLTEREKMLAHVYYGLMVMMTANEASEEEETDE